MSKLKIRRRAKYRINRAILLEIELSKKIRTKMKPLFNELFGSSLTSMFVPSWDTYDYISEYQNEYLYSKVKHRKKRYN